MSTVPTEFWPWLALVVLGLFHGINPAGGWLFAVALGLNRASQRVVLLSILPIAAGHVLAVGAVLFAALALGIAIDSAVLRTLIAALLIGWGLWHLAYGYRQRLVVGMQTGLVGLGLWSFLMANAHGAGFMLVPVMLPICGEIAPDGRYAMSDIFPVTLAVLSIHSAAMLAAIAAISVAVYKWIGVGFLRRGWINLDWIWAGALIACGLGMLVL
jgi:hypothetical protein